jgi:hypothetical protein
MRHEIASGIAQYVTHKQVVNKPVYKPFGARCLFILENFIIKKGGLLLWFVLLVHGGVLALWVVVVNIKLTNQNLKIITN